MFWLLTLAYFVSIAASSYAGAKYGAQAGAAVKAAEARLVALEQAAKAKLAALEAKL